MAKHRNLTTGELDAPTRSSINVALYGVLRGGRFDLIAEADWDAMQQAGDGSIIERLLYRRHARILWRRGGQYRILDPAEPDAFRYTEEELG